MAFLVKPSSLQLNWRQPSGACHKTYKHRRSLSVSLTGTKQRTKLECGLCILTFLSKFSKYIKDGYGCLFCLWHVQQDNEGGLCGSNHRETAVLPWLSGVLLAKMGAAAPVRKHSGLCTNKWFGILRHSFVISPFLSSSSLILEER